MGFGCPICSEKLDKLPAEAQQAQRRTDTAINISATPCGHMFHAYCIQKWLSGNFASSKQCPCCRKDVPRLRCLSLYPTSFDDSILDDSMSQAGAAGAAIPCNHDTIISSLKDRLKRVEGDLEENKRLYDLLSEDYTTMNDKYRNEKLSTDMWMMRAKEFESYKDVAAQLGPKTQRLEQKLKTYKQLESLIKGVETSVAEEMSSFPATIDSVQTLVEMKLVLSSELRNASKRLTSVNQTVDSLRSENVKLRSQTTKYQQDLKELEQVLETVRINGKLRSTSPVAGPSRTLNIETPEAFRLKRRFQDESSIYTPEAGAAAEAIRSPGLDMDVDVFPISMGIATKKKKQVKIAPDAIADNKRKAERVRKFSCKLSPVKPIGSTDDNAAETSLLDVGPRNSTMFHHASASSSDYEGLLGSDDDDFNIRGTVPGAPLPVSAKRVKNLQEKAEKPVLGIGKARFRQTRKPSKN